MKSTLLILGISLLSMLAPANAAEIVEFTKTTGGCDCLVDDLADLELFWNFRTEDRWDQVIRIVQVTFELRVRDDARSAPLDGPENFRYVFLPSDPNFRIFGDASPEILPSGSGNTDYISTAFLDGATSSNGGVLSFDDVIDGRFRTRLRVTSKNGDLEFRRARVIIDAVVSPEPASIGLLTAGAAFAALVLKRRRAAR